MKSQQVHDYEKSLLNIINEIVEEIINFKSDRVEKSSLSSQH